MVRIWLEILLFAVVAGGAYLFDGPPTSIVGILALAGLCVLLVEVVDLRRRMRRISGSILRYNAKERDRVD